jgi:hypothetical protein
MPFFHYPPEIRRAIYTTNSVESLNRSLRKIIKTRGGFPNRRSRAEAVVSRLAAGGQEVYDADSSLARSLEPLHDSVAGTNAGTGENCVMKAQNPSTSLGEGKGRYLFLAHPSPETKLGRSHRRVDRACFENLALSLLASSFTGTRLLPADSCPIRL